MAPDTGNLLTSGKPDVLRWATSQRPSPKCEPREPAEAEQQQVRRAQIALLDRQSPTSVAHAMHATGKIFFLAIGLFDPASGEHLGSHPFPADRDALRERTQYRMAPFPTRIGPHPTALADCYRVKAEEFSVLYNTAMLREILGPTVAVQEAEGRARKLVEALRPTLGVTGCACYAPPTEVPGDQEFVVDPCDLGAAAERTRFREYRERLHARVPEEEADANFATHRYVLLDGVIVGIQNLSPRVSQNHSPLLLA